MNAYILLTQKNVHINDIPPRLMWNIDDDNWNSSASGYCGETSVLSAGLLYGQYVPMYLIRQLLADYFSHLWGSNPDEPSSELKNMWENYFGDWNGDNAPGKDYAGSSESAESFHAWFKKRGQYYCQLLPQIWNDSKDADNSAFEPTNVVLRHLHLEHEHFWKKKQHTKKNFIPWIKKHVLKGHSVVIGVQDFLADSSDTDFDHIVTVIGWGSNQDFSDNQYFHDDEIIFSDHGLVVGGQQPQGGSIPYYFRYVMETKKSIHETGGWLPDGGCPDKTNPAWNFIMDLGECRTLNEKAEPSKNGKRVCNTYQLAQSPSELKKKGSVGNAGFAITGLGNKKHLAPDVQVRIDTDCYYQVPCITTHQAQTGEKPASAQKMTHHIKISGLDINLSYNIWFFKAKDTEELRQIPHKGFNKYGKQNNVECYTISGQTNANYRCQLEADAALFVRCVLTTER